MTTVIRRAKTLCRRPRSRRGVVAVLSMMFMVLFGSLAAAMAIVSKGNLQTAQTHLVVTRALGAADTGIRLAEARLKEATAELLIERGTVDAAFAEDLWLGTYGASDGQVLTKDGSIANIGIRDVLLAMHAADNTVDIDSEYPVQDSWARTLPVVLDVNPTGEAIGATQITYVPVPGAGTIRAIVTGYAWDFMGRRWITRTSQQEFSIHKRVEHAILGPAKIMIGRNVQINGDLGAIFEEVNNVGGHPLVVQSDFRGLDPILDAKLDDFYDVVRLDDVDGDNRLAEFHTIESRSLGTLNASDYDGDTSGDGAFRDDTTDGYIDEWDIFLRHFDNDGDQRVTLSNDLTAGTPAQSFSPEFIIDDDLGEMLDAAVPDRNNDGVVDAQDQILGYRDGFLDYRDRYAKVRGGISIRAKRADWEASPTTDGGVIGDYQPFVEGVIRPELDQNPIVFDVPVNTLPDVNTNTFDTAHGTLSSMADGGDFASQAGVGLIWTPVLNPDGTIIGQLFDPGIETITESTPFDSPAPADWYIRPVFRDTIFKDVVIPRGLNALFVNCTFVGVTRIESYQNNIHEAWQFYGQQKKDGSLKYPPPPATSDAQLDNEYYTGSLIKPSGFNVPRLVVDGVKYATTKPLSNNVRFESCTFVGSVVADKPTVYTHVRNKLQFTGATRFFREHPDFPDDPTYNPQAADQSEIDKSAMLLPHYSVDIGKNNASPDQDVNLRGLIIAGVLDIRGNTHIDGALLLTFKPSSSDPALQHFGQPAGNPANYNITLGYFGSEDGDEEGLAPFEFNGDLIVGFDLDGDGYVDSTEPGLGVPVPFNGYGKVVIDWNPNLSMPDGLLSPVSSEPIRATYREGRIDLTEFTP
jgi:hypothetical protein